MYFDEQRHHCSVPRSSLSVSSITRAASFKSTAQSCTPSTGVSKCLVPYHAGNIGTGTYHAISCFAFTIPRLHHSFSVLNPTVVYFCRNVATLNACTDIFNIFIYMNLVVSVFINMLISIAPGHFYLISSECCLTNFFFRELRELWSHT